MIIRFSGPCVEVVMGHKELPDFPADGTDTRKIKSIKPIAKKWFDEEEPSWFEVDNEYHTQSPLLSASLSMGIYKDDGSELVYPLFDSFAHALKIREFPYRLEMRHAPHRRGDTEIGVLAWESSRGVNEYIIPHDEIDPGKISFIITRFSGLCDITEDDTAFYLITGVLYDNQELEQADISCTAVDARAVFNFIDSYEDGEQSEEDVSDRMTEINFREL